MNLQIHQGTYWFFLKVCNQCWVIKSPHSYPHFHCIFSNPVLLIWFGMCSGILFFRLSSSRGLVVCVIPSVKISVDYLQAERWSYLALGSKKSSHKQTCVKEEKNWGFGLFVFHFFHYASFSLSTEFGMRSIHLKGIDISLDF